MRTTKLSVLACTALVLASGVACGKTETTTPAQSGGAIAEAQSSKSDGSTTTKKGSDSGNKTTTTDSSSDPTTKTTNKKTTTTQRGSTDNTDVTIPDVSVPGGLPGNLDDCLKAATALSSIASASGVLMSPTATKADVQKLQDQIAEVRKSVPSELKGDFDVWSKAWSAYGKILGEVMDNGGLTNPANVDRLQKLNDVFDDPAWKKANDNINAYFAKACK